MKKFLGILVLSLFIEAEIFRKEIYAKIVGRDLEFRPLLDITYDCKKAEKKF